MSVGNAMITLVASILAAWYAPTGWHLTVFFGCMVIAHSYAEPRR